MPLRLPDLLPAIELLKHENIFVMDYTRAHMQDIRPLKIVIFSGIKLRITIFKGRIPVLICRISVP